MRNGVRILGFAVLLLLGPSVTLGAIPNLVNFQGCLTDLDGAPVADGNYDLTFTIHTDSVGGTQLWSETQIVAVQASFFTVVLGAVTRLPDTVFEYSPDLYVGIQLGLAPALAGRLRLTSNPFSYHALHADTAEYARGTGAGAGGWVDDGTLVRLETITDKVGIGVTETKSKLEVNGDVNASMFRIRDTIIVSNVGQRTLSLGFYAGREATSEECTFVGDNAGRDGGGIGNTFIGFRSGYFATGTANVFLGHSAGYHVTTGTGNVLLGYYAGYNATGSRNVFIGYKAGYDETGDYKLYIGGGTVPLIYGDFDSEKIGMGTAAPSTKLEVSDVVRITGASMWPSAGEGLELAYNPTLNRGFILARDRTGGTYGDLYLGDGRVGIGTSTPDSKLHISGGEVSVNLLLEADTENIGEGDQPSITMTQDGGAVVGELGYFDSSNDLSLVNRYAGSLVLGTADSTALTVTNAMNVGVGTTNPFSHRMKVYSELAGSGSSTLLAQNGAPAGAGGIALHAVSNGTALYARGEGSTSVGMVVYGGSAAYAGKFYGNVALYSLTDSHMILELGEGLDYAEGFDISNDSRVEPGTVLAIDPVHPGHLTICREAYDSKVAGIAAGAKSLGSGVRLGGDGFDVDVALAGRVYCNVDATGEAIEPGDLLSTSPLPGFAMKVTDHERARGAILGKAMEPLAKGQKGQILVLVTLQ